ncbi:hypothetical protein ACJMK2_000652 [Sinanodonta woodiana]|uniref:Uncharacterized protein n=1 Tax=Sinanodonta woodiana TaxID=1069815 RepID=A0ABD3XRP0_SINWO
MYLQNSPETEMMSGSIGLKLKEHPNPFVTSCSVEEICMSDSDTEKETDNILAWDTASNSSDSSNNDRSEGLHSLVQMRNTDYPKVSSSGSTTGYDFAEKVVDEAMSARESLTDSSITSLKISGTLRTIFKLQEPECKGKTYTDNIAWKNQEYSTIKRQMKTVSTKRGDLINGVVNAEVTQNIAEQVSVRISESAEDDGMFKKTPNYRHSKPLIKTYIIKMLFFAMKAAFPDEKEWKEDKLSTLVLLAMQMLYFAFCSKEKGFLNFWFQDFIENRTRDSTSL